jgi:hypothetical protein
MPHYVQVLAHGSPAFWGLQGLHKVILTHAGVVAIGPELAVMGASSMALAGIGLWRMRFDESKRFYA